MEVTKDKLEQSLEPNADMVELESFIWSAGGTGRCAMGWLYPIASKQNGYYVIVDYRISTMDANGHHLDGAPFIGEKEFLLAIWKRIKDRKVRNPKNLKELAFKVEMVEFWKQNIKEGKTNECPYSVGWSANRTKEEIEKTEKLIARLEEATECL